jgi:hypothetical protein
VPGQIVPGKKQVRRFRGGNLYHLCLKENPTSTDVFYVAEFRDYIQSSIDNNSYYLFTRIVNNMDLASSYLIQLTPRTVSKLYIYKVSLEDLPLYINCTYISQQYSKLLQGLPIRRPKVKYLVNS